MKLTTRLWVGVLGGSNVVVAFGVERGLGLVVGFDDPNWLMTLLDRETDEGGVECGTAGPGPGEDIEDAIAP